MRCPAWHFGDRDIDLTKYESAVVSVIKSGNGSTNRLHRELQISYLEAYELMVMMEQDGVVSTPDDNGRRYVRNFPVRACLGLRKY
ncbi:DNA translocase FtsK [Sphingobium phenoxybenzoativorans]|uniref:DNA translocase FtsK n=1 Tax=Sphingobium phenoxybenzoativorans TaxID=1592790 RepID=UPI0009F528D8